MKLNIPPVKDNATITPPCSSSSLSSPGVWGHKNRAFPISIWLLLTTGARIPEKAYQGCQSAGHVVTVGCSCWERPKVVLLVLFVSLVSGDVTLICFVYLQQPLITLQTLSLHYYDLTLANDDKEKLT